MKNKKKLIKFSVAGALLLGQFAAYGDDCPVLYMCCTGSPSAQNCTPAPNNSWPCPGSAFCSICGGPTQGCDTSNCSVNTTPQCFGNEGVALQTFIKQNALTTQGAKTVPDMVVLKDGTMPIETFKKYYNQTQKNIWIRKK